MEHTAPAISDKDSVPVMTTYGVNTLISDSGVIKYRIVTERWEINQSKNPSCWIFDKGVLLEQFDQTFHVNSYIQCDSAWHYDERKMWILRGRVRILTKDGLRFSSEQLYWDENNHQLWSNSYSRLVTPERTLEGNYFKSDERMTKYVVTNTKGSFERADIAGGESPADTMRSQPDSVKAKVRPQAIPRAKQTTIPLP